MLWAVLLWLGLASLDAETWTKADGSTMEAEVTGIVQRGDTLYVTFRNAGGSFHLPLHRLAEADQRRILGEPERPEPASPPQPQPAPTSRQTLPQGIAFEAPEVTPMGSPLRQVLNNGLLVRLSGGRLQPYEIRQAPMFYLFFFGSAADEPSQKTAALLESFQQQYASSSHLFQIVFVSADDEPAEMTGFMEQAPMSYPAMRFEERFSPQAAPIIRILAIEMPKLVLMDFEGGILSTTSRNAADGLAPPQVVGYLQQLVLANR